MIRLPLNLKTEELNRSRLVVLEKLGLVHEASDCSGYYRSMSSMSMDQLPPSGDPVDDEKLRSYMIKRQREAEVNRARRIQRLRRLARMDFKMVGGVSPIGFFGGSGGSDGGTVRPSSISPRM
jgi:hypothetical protein